jgi:zinc transport system substrate-binding protein
MKKILLVALLLTTTLFAKLDICVSILPQQTFVKKITKDLANIHLIVKPGNSPHSYEPKPSQMVDISKSDIYFTIGVEFEHAWMDRFKSQNRELKFISLDKGITKQAIQKHSHHDEDNHKGHKDHDHHDHGHHKHDKKHKKGLDPHVWTSPANVKIIAKNIYNALVKIDPTNKKEYNKNYKEFLQEIDNTDKKIKSILSKKSNDTFMVFHPAWGYYAKQYGLHQLAIEAGGKSPKMKQLLKLIKEAKENNIKVIFTHPEFNDKSAKLIAKETGAKVIKLSPLNPKWSKNLIKMTKVIAN